MNVKVRFALWPLQMLTSPAMEAVGNAFTVNVTEVAALEQPFMVSVTNTVMLPAAAELNPSWALVGLMPVVNTVVKPASLYQV